MIYPRFMFSMLLVIAKMVFFAVLHLSRGKRIFRYVLVMILQFYCIIVSVTIATIIDYLEVKVLEGGGPLVPYWTGL